MNLSNIFRQHIKKAISLRRLLLYIALFPCGPDFRAVANCGLFSVADNGCFHQTRVIKNLVLFCHLIVHVFHIGDFLTLAVPVNQIVDTSNRPNHTVELLAGHTEAYQIDRLKFHPTLFKIALCFFRIKALAFSKNLYIQYSTSIRHRP